MRTQWQCKMALHLGCVLTNGLCLVRLKDGKQEMSGKIGKGHRDGRPYSFDSPQYWGVMTYPKGWRRTMCAIFGI